MRSVTLDGVEIVMEKKRVKNINISVKKGEVHISVPQYVSYSEAKDFAAQKLPWIKKSLERLKNTPDEKPAKVLSGDKVFVLGKEYTAEVFYSEKKKDAVLGSNTLFLYSKQDNAMPALENYYRALLAQILPPLISGWEGYMGVASSGFRFRNMKTRWGVCNIKTHEICFNSSLASKDAKCIEYIVVHELCHLLEPSHNARFKSLMDGFLPDWRERKKLLNTIKG